MDILRKIGVLMVMAFIGTFVVYSATKAPDFKLVDIQGKQVSLSALKGKVVVLNFWATWCPPCKREIPDFVKTYEKYKNNGLVIIGVAVNSEIEEVKNLVKQYKITYPVVMSNGSIEQAYGNITAVPTTFIIDKQGNLAPGGKKIGMFMEGELEKIVQPLLK